MRRYPKWVLTLGMLAVTPGLSAAAFPFGGDADGSSSTAAAPEDQPQSEDGRTRLRLALRKAQFHGYEIEIEYKDGTATLTGKVSDPAQKVKANQVVGRVPGVQRLDNRLAIVAASRGAIRQVTAETRVGRPRHAGCRCSHGRWRQPRKGHADRPCSRGRRFEWL